MVLHLTEQAKSDGRIKKEVLFVSEMYKHSIPENTDAVQQSDKYIV